MNIEIRKVKIRKRIRKEIGDVNSLMLSLKTNGLLNPIVIDKKFYLLAGYRRLIAAKKLGWKIINAAMIDANTELKRLNIELDENITRKDFTPTELQKGLKQRNELLKMANMNPFFRFFYIIYRTIKRFIQKIFRIDEG